MLQSIEKAQSLAHLRREINGAASDSDGFGVAEKRTTPETEG